MVGLTSPRMRRVLNEAAEVFDWVVVDTPPIGPVATIAGWPAVTASVIGKTSAMAAMKAWMSSKKWC